MLPRLNTLDKQRVNVSNSETDRSSNSFFALVEDNILYEELALRPLYPPPLQISKELAGCFNGSSRNLVPGSRRAVGISLEACKMPYYSDKENEGMNAADISDSENEDSMHTQMAHPVSSIRSAKLDKKSSLDGLPKSVNDFFQSMNMNCFPEAKGMEAKAQPWRQIWTGSPSPSDDGKLLVACPKNCQWGSGSGLGGY